MWRAVGVRVTAAINSLRLGSAAAAMQVPALLECASAHHELRRGDSTLVVFVPRGTNYAGLPKASVISVFCSSSWALAEPVAGVEFAARLMLRSLEPRIRVRRAVTNESAPMLAGSSCTQMNWLAFL